ncbi:MAG: methyltransferase domain-containing protein [Chloroflexi bacterium]|nr:methyltransferase domain-containing protein [Chloroflexota bacterium]
MHQSHYTRRAHCCYNRGVSQSPLDLPFDQFQRHAVARDVLRLVLADRLADARILDVGGGPGATARLVPAAAVVSVDLQATTGALGVVADGAALPFGDRAFDAALCLDTLEHIRPAQRTRALSELARVARLVVVAGPGASPEVVRAEQVVQELVRASLGVEQRQLREHADYGLPAPSEIEMALPTLAVQWRCFPSGRLDHWVLLMAAKHLSLAAGQGERLPLERAYNARWTAPEAVVPAYRTVFVFTTDPAVELGRLDAWRRGDGVTPSPGPSPTGRGDGAVDDWLAPLLDAALVAFATGLALRSGTEVAGGPPLVEFADRAEYRGGALGEGEHLSRSRKVHLRPGKVQEGRSPSWRGLGCPQNHQKLSDTYLLAELGWGGGRVAPATLPLNPLGGGEPRCPIG